MGAYLQYASKSPTKVKRAENGRCHGWWKGKEKEVVKRKIRDKVDNKVLFGKDQYERFQNEVPKMKLITVSGVVEKLKISGGLAKRALADMEKEGKIREVLTSRSQKIYTRAIAEEGEDDE